MSKYFKGILFACALVISFLLAGQTVDATTVTGSVYKDNVAVGQSWLKIHKTDEQSKWHNVWLGNGQFSENLENGSYEADEYWDNTLSDYVQLAKSFTVTDDVYEFRFDVPSANVTGTLKEDGVNVDEVWLNIHREGNNYKQFNAYVKNGTFKIYLTDGNYVVDGYYSNIGGVSQYVRLNESFTVSGSAVPLTLTASPKLQGTVKYPNNSNAPNGWVYFHNKDSYWGYSGQVTDGKFSLRLPDGDYIIDGYWEGDSQEYTQLSKSFTVQGGSLTALDALNIQIPIKNVHGTLKWNASTLVTNTWLSIQKLHPDSNDANQWFGAQVKDNGTFAVALPDGEYQFTGFWDSGSQKYIQLFATFTVANGTVTNQNVLDNLMVPQNNVQGTLTVDSQAAAGAWLNLHNTDTQLGHGFQVDDSGAFSFYLPNGTYKIDGYWNKSTQSYEQLNQTITIVNGVADATKYDIVINHNVRGTLKKSSTPVSNAWLHVYTASNNNYQGYNARVTSGNFALALPDGDYRIDGYWDETAQKYVQYAYTFKVVNGANITINLIVPEENVSGTVLNADGNTVERGNLNLHRSDWKQGYNTDIVDGAFKLYLPDGDYQIDGYWDQSVQDHVRVNPLNFTVSGGHTTTVLEIKEPKKNVTGTLKQGEQLIQGAWLNLHSIGNQPVWYNIHVKNGIFSAALPEGTYQLEGFYNEITQEQVSYLKEFKVASSTEPTVVTLEVPGNNVNGTIQTTGQKPIDDVILNIHSETAKGYKGYSVSVKAGQFSLYLPDGNYRVNGYWNSVTSEQVTLDYSFTVINGQSNPNPIQIAVPDKNVFGTLSAADGNGTSMVKEAWLDIFRKDGTKGYNTAVKDGKFSLYLPDGDYVIHGYWDNASQERVSLSYSFKVTNGISNPNPIVLSALAKNVFGTIETEDHLLLDQLYISIQTREICSGMCFSYNTTVKQGKFSLYLPDGSYVIHGYYDPAKQTFVELRYEFSVVNGQSDPNPLHIVKMNDNVTGTLSQKDGSLIDQANISLHSVAADSKWYGAPVVNGQFSMYLPDGQYEVEGYKTWNGSYVTLKYSFTVTNGNPNPNPLQIVAELPNVNGTVTRQNGTKVTSGNLHISSTNSTTKYGFSTEVRDGQFSVFLPDGDYIVDHLWDSATQQGVQLRYTFKVTNGKPDPSVLQVILMDNNVFGKISYEDGTNPGNVFLNIHSTGSTSQQAFGYNVAVKEGAFSTYLPDGDYQVEGFWVNDSKDYVTLSDSFTVTNGVSTPNPVSITIKNKNVLGTLQDKNGNKITYGWVYISLPGTGKQMALRVIDGHFGLYLAEGSYSIIGYRDESTMQQSVNFPDPIPFAVSGGTTITDLVVTTP